MDQTVTRNSSNFKVVHKQFVQDSGEKENGVETPTTVDKTQVEQPNSNDPRKNTPLRHSKANQAPC